MPVLTAGRFAAATSVLALVVAMGGTGYAAVKIGGNQIKKNAITSKHVKNNSLTGKDLEEGSLAKVPSAGVADSAATATNAAKVNGITPSKVVYREASSTPVVVFTGAGLTITAACVADDIELIATTSKNDSQIYSVAVDLEGDDLLTVDLENGQFNTTSSVDLLAGSTSPEEDPALLTFEYDAPDGAVVTGNLATDHSQGSGSGCGVTGIVMAG